MEAEESVTLNNKYGLHSRPATKIVEIAKQFDCDIRLIHGGMEVDAKSVINILMLGAEKGSELVIKANGENSSEAVSRIRKIIEDKFGEE